MSVGEEMICPYCDEEIGTGEDADQHMSDCASDFATWDDLVWGTE